MTGFAPLTPIIYTERTLNNEHYFNPNRNLE